MSDYKADWAAKDFYQELGVAKDATQTEIKKAYRKLARENHPDSNPDNKVKHDRFKAVAEAYDVLGDVDKRKKYDELRAMGAFPGGFGGGGYSGGNTNFDLADLFGRGSGGGLGDMFGDILGAAGQGRGRTSSRPRRGADAETEATISFADSLVGVTISLRLASDAPCTTCSGTGGKPGTMPRPCPTCDGSGAVVVSAGGGFTMQETCPGCAGRQLVYHEACPTCLGSGRGQSARTIQARIPGGVKEGARIRLKGKGSPGLGGAPAGDLFVRVKVTPHRLFGRKGDHLTLEVPVAFDELALGSEIKVPTLGGAPVVLKVPAGTPDGRAFRIRGKGVKKSDGTAGDLLVTVRVQVPAILDDNAREAVEAYRLAMAGKPLRSGLFEEA
jgi:molecular chaperone DnaJ